MPTLRPRTSQLLIAALLLGSVWATDFKVQDFGASGNGTTDDAPAARRALAAALEAGPGSRVVFEKKTYRFGRQSEDAILSLDGASGVTLEGNGAEIIGNPWNSFLRISDCRDITMRGFVLDCDPLSFTQGDIIRVAPDEGTFLLRIHKGYANPVELGEQPGRKSWHRAGFTIDAKERRLKPGPIDFIRSITEQDRTAGLLRIHLEAERFTHIAVGDRFVIGLHHGSHGGLITVERSSGIRLEDYTIHGGKFGMNHAFFDNHGRVHVKGARITFRPDTRHLITSIKDGFHVKHNRIGPIIEDCVLEGMMDDAINISVCPYWVKEDLGENRYLIAELQYAPKVGDRLMAYTPLPGTVADGLEVIAVETSQSHAKRSEKWSIVTLDRPIPGLSLHQGGNLFPGGPDKLRFTGLYNLDACGHGYIVRNNRFLPQRRHALLARGSGGLFEENTIDGIGGSGVWLRNEIGSFYEGPFPADTIIRNNRFHDTGGEPIHVGARGNHAWARNITIEGNTFSGWPGSAMRLSRLQGGVIRGNTIEAGRGEAAGSVAVVVTDSNELRIGDNAIRDERPGLTAAIDLSGDIDPASLVMSDNPVTLAADFPQLMAIIPPPSIQRRGEDIRPLRSAEDAGAFLRAGPGERRSDAPVWTLHPPWKNGPKGALLFELPANLTDFHGIRFATRSASGLGDGVVLTVDWKPVGAPDKAYRRCYESTILGKEWTADHAKIDSGKASVLLRFRFDCGPADDAGYDTVQITKIDVFHEGDGRLRVEDFGAVGDGAHDDRPAIFSALEAARMDGIPSTVVFGKKTYRLGDNPAAWHCFPMVGHEDLVIEGNGATLLCAEGNMAFHFEGGRNITLRGLTFDMDRPGFTQGGVLSVDPAGTLDVKIMDGYPEPPDEAFLTANRHLAHGGGGRHMIVFEKGGGARNTRMANDHLYIRNITRVSPGVFRFHVKEDYLPAMKGLSPGNWITYGFNKVNLAAAVVAAKDKSASIYGQIAADRVENITFEEIDIFGSINGGIRVSDMPGDVTLRKVRIIRKPGTRNLLSTISDALHLMNIRGRMIMEDCTVEAAGDDCLNLGAQRDRVLALDGADPQIVTLRSTDNHYYHYTIRKGDQLQFLDTASNKVLGVRTVTANAFNPRNLTHRVNLDREVPGLVPEKAQVMNLDHNTSSTVIRNNTVTPYMRHALLARARNMTIEGNRLDCSKGGVYALSLSLASGLDDARLRDVRITDNAFNCPANIAIVANRPYQDEDGMSDSRNLSITGNTFQVGTAKAIKIRGIHGLDLRDNRFIREGRPVTNASDFIEIKD
jgi:hypothetical protein